MSVAAQTRANIFMFPFCKHTAGANQKCAEIWFGHKLTIFVSFDDIAAADLADLQSSCN